MNDITFYATCFLLVWCVTFWPLNYCVVWMVKLLPKIIDFYEVSIAVSYLKLMEFKLLSELFSLELNLLSDLFVLDGL